ncbi:MAG TPA: hypothetical protein DEP23_02390 [Ruminococcaceae bacterium]|nr:hypothetical protein [Oscillospiraceae bacterium]
MKIERKVTKTEIESEAEIANYSADEIKKLIMQDLEKQGYKADSSDIKFSTDWHYETDEWGMNRFVKTNFFGARVKVR